MAEFASLAITVLQLLGKNNLAWAVEISDYPQIAL